MRKIDNEQFYNWIEAFAKSGIKFDTNEEYEEAIYNLTNYFEILIQMDKQLEDSKKD